MHIYFFTRAFRYLCEFFSLFFQPSFQVLQTFLSQKEDGVGEGGHSEAQGQVMGLGRWQTRHESWCKICMFQYLSLGILNANYAIWFYSY